MNALVVDIGTSSAKAGWFTDGKLVKKEKGLKIEEVKHLISSSEDQGTNRIIISSVSEFYDRIVHEISEGIHLLTANSRLNFKMKYESPDTLGTDRIAAVAGARDLYPDQDCLIIDGGTCITYDYISKEGNYLGGGISPGMELKFKALHNYTARLPLLQREEEVDLIGNSTEKAILSGVIQGTVAEITEIIRNYQQKSRHLRLVICGGDADYYSKRLKAEIDVVPDLVLYGLYAILKYNE